jgi:hypothetical protein
VKRYEKLFLSWKQHVSMYEGVPGHNHGLDDCEYVIDRSVMLHVQAEDERGVWWGELTSGDGLRWLSLDCVHGARELN